MRGAGDDDMADLFVGKEFDRCVGEDAEESGGMTTKEAADATLMIDAVESGEEASEGAGIASVLRRGGLEEDLDAVEWRD